MSRPRLIFHADMDAFYASVEQRDDPSLRGLPVIVGGRDRRGVVAAASYEARQFGIRSAMPVREALRRCPDAVCVRPRMAHYREVSQIVFAVFRDVTPDIQGLSLDEAFLDVTAVVHLYPSAQALAQAIKDEVRERTELTVSVGGGPNKLVAKIASDLQKPDGLCLVAEEDVQRTLDPLAASVIPGVGPKTAKRLTDAGISTIQSLRTASVSRLRPVFGRYAERMIERASGIDERPIVSNSDDKSISTEQTFSENVGDSDEMVAHIRRMAEKVADRVRRKGLCAGVIRLKIRTPDFRTVTRQQAVQPPSSETRLFGDVAARLMRTWQASHARESVRLLGVGAGDLTSEQQLNLFAQPGDGVDSAVDQVRERFGADSLKRGSRLNE
ncbi:MAG: DNA polymerase IV [Pseudomonadota bacterium]